MTSKQAFLPLHDRMSDFKFNDSYLDQRTEDHYQTLLHRVASRRASSESLDWLLHSSNIARFMPDYLHLVAWGRNRFERALNRNIRNHALFLWYCFFWPKISRGIIAYTATRYLPGFFQQQTDHDEHTIAAVFQIGDSRRPIDCGDSKSSA